MEYIRSSINIANPGISWDKRKILLEKNIHKFLLPKKIFALKKKILLFLCLMFSKKYHQHPSKLLPLAYHKKIMQTTFFFDDLKRVAQKFTQSFGILQIQALRA